MALLDAAPAKQIDPDLLRLMGKQASNQYLRNGTPLTESVVKLAEEHRGMGPEHIKRVCEFANGETFQAKFAAGAGQDRYVEFPTADPDAALAALEIQDRPPAPPKLSDYHMGPETKRTDFSELASIFGKTASAEMPKEAAPSIPQMLAVASLAAGVPAAALGMVALVKRMEHDLDRVQDPDQLEPAIQALSSGVSTPGRAVAEKVASNPHHHVLELHEKVKGHREHLESEHLRLEMEEDSILDDAVHATKVACLDYGVEDTVAVMYHAADKNPRAAGEMFQKMAGRLNALGVTLESDGTKLASAMTRFPDPETRLFQTTQALHKVAEARKEVGEMVSRLKEAEAELSGYIRESGIWR